MASEDNRLQSSLVSLSGDILCQIFSYVHDLALPRLLLLTGCYQLKHKASRFPIDLRHELSSPFGRVYRLKALISLFPRIRSLHIHAGSYVRSHEDLLDYETMISLPRTLEELNLQFDTALGCFLVELPYRSFQSPFLLDTYASMHRKLLNMSALFPNLQKLHFRSNLTLESLNWSELMISEWLENLPRSLRSCAFPNCFKPSDNNFKRHLSSKNIEYLRIQSPVGPEFDFSTLSQLSSLECQQIDATALKMLPPTVKAITLHQQSITPMDWPHSLTSISSWPTVTIFKANWFDTLPPHLTSLSIRTLGDSLPKIPKQLKELEVYFTSPFQWLQHMPPGLTRLLAHNGEIFHQETDLELLPPHLTSLELSTRVAVKFSTIESLPPALTNLTLPIAYTESLEILVKHIPNVRTLNLKLGPKVDTSCLQYASLPALRNLVIQSLKVPRHHIEHLFPQLHQLEADINDTSQQQWRSRETIYFDFLRSLPPLLRPGYTGNVE